MVLVCLDRSRLAQVVLPYARILAGVADARITLINVIEEPEEGDSPHRHDALRWKLHRAEALIYLKSVQTRIRSQGIHADIQLEQGRTADRLLTFAKQGHCDFIVLSTHGDRGITEWSLSSTAAKVLSRAHSSFLIVPAASSLEHPGDLHIRRILIPLDGSPRAESTLPLAVRIAREQESELIMVHAVEQVSVPPMRVPSTTDGRMLDGTAAVLRTVSAQHFEQLAGRLRNEGLEVRLIVGEQKSPLDLIYDSIAEWSPDMVVLSAHGASGGNRFLFGRTAEHLIWHAPAPLLVLQDLSPRHVERALATRRFDTIPFGPGNRPIDSIE